MRVPVPPHLEELLGYLKGLRAHQKFWEELTEEERVLFIASFPNHFIGSRERGIQLIEARRRQGG